jgi:hypothetical protein
MSIPNDDQEHRPRYIRCPASPHRNKSHEGTYRCVVCRRPHLRPTPHMACTDQGAPDGISAVIVYPMNALAEDRLGMDTRTWLLCHPSERRMVEEINTAVGAHQDIQPLVGLHMDYHVYAQNPLPKTCEKMRN